MPEKKKEKDDRRGAGALFIPAGLFLGFGVGFLTNNLVAWMFTGLGLGFAAFAATLLIKKK